MNKLIGKVFSLDGRPLLTLSGELEAESEAKNDQKGFMQIFKGCVSGHSESEGAQHDATTRREMKGGAVGWCSALSLLARDRIDEAR